MSNLLCKLMGFAGVSEAVGLGRSTIYKRVAEGTFPKPVALGAHCVRWRSDEIGEWIEAQTTRAGDDLASLSRAKKASAARKTKAKSDTALIAAQAA